MKRIVLSALTIALCGMLTAQVTTPQPSTKSKMEQTVGLTDISVSYSRPSVKGRKIFGNLVPFDKIWRTGANMNTVVTFADDVTIGESTLKAGDYALYTKPGKTDWEIYFYSDTKNWGTPRNWDDKKVAAKLSVKSSSTPMPVELFTILINSKNNTSGEILLSWENTMVSIPVQVPTDKKAMASIDKALNIGPNDYFSSAVYYLNADKDIEQAKTWIDKACEMTKEKPRYWYLRQQALITAKAGNKKQAIKIAEKSLELAKEAGDNSYVLSNTTSIKEWSKK
ncbi:MAG: DUF2911 domain-containing protein [Flavobacteriales bacterium]